MKYANLSPSAGERRDRAFSSAIASDPAAGGAGGATPRCETLRRQAEEALDLAHAFAYPTGDPERETDYVATFGHVTSKEAPPYETHYGVAHLFQQTQRMADLAGLYRAFGVSVQPGSERADHISVELEFAAFLAAKEAYAAERNEGEVTATCRKARRTFVENHLAAWVPAFAARLRDRAQGPYRQSAEQLRRWLAETCRELGVERAGPDDAKITFPAWTPQTDCLSCPASDSQEDAS